MTEIHYASALMGSGKTQSFIEQVDPDGFYIFATPKIDLCNSVAGRLRDVGVLAEVYHSDTVNKYEKVYQEVQKALTKAEGGKVVITTHASLLKVDPELLDGWIVVIDEVPNIINNRHCRVEPITYKQLFNGLLDEFSEEIEGVVRYLDDKEDTVRALFADSNKERSGVKPYHAVFGGLLSSTAQVTRIVEQKNGAVNFHVVDYHDYSQIVENSQETHILGNAIDKTLFSLHMESCGFKVKQSRYMPPPFSYKIPPKLVPCVAGNTFSKNLMYTREDGTVAESFDESCMGWKLLINALGYHENNSILVQAYSWMKESFPFDEYENVEVPDFDVRGINRYSKYDRTISITHGNPQPEAAKMHIKLLKMLEIGEKEGKEAIRHEQHIENMAQFIARTDMRNGINQTKQTIAVVPTMADAKALEEVLQIQCEIDDSLMISRPKKPVTKAKQTRGDLQEKAKQLKAVGKTNREIAEDLGKGVGTISRWLNDVEEKAA